MNKLDDLIAQAAVEPEPEPHETAQAPETTAQEVAPETGAAEAPKTEQAPTIDRYGILSETLGRQFASDEDIETFKSSLTSTEEKLKEWELKEQAWAKEKEEIESGLDESKLYPNEWFRTLAKLMIKYPDKNPIAMTEIISNDFSRAYLDNPINVLALDLMNDSPEIYTSKERAEEVIARKYNLEKDENGKWEMDDITKSLIQTEAKKSVASFNALKAEVPPATKIDLSATRAEKIKAGQERVKRMTEVTDTLFTKTIPASLKAIEIPITIKDEGGNEVTEVAFKYDIPDSYAKSKVVRDIIDSVRNATIQNEAEWTPAKEKALQADVSDMLVANYFYKNRSEIYSALREDLTTKFKDEAWLKRHNVRPLRVDGKAPVQTDQQKKEEQGLKDVSRQIGIKSV